MFRNFNLAVLALFSTVSAKKCYDLIGTFDLEEVSLDAELNICWPKSSLNGELGTGKGVYDNGSANGQALTITHAWIADDTVLTLWLKMKNGRTTNLCSIMCVLDDEAHCSGYYSCQPDGFGEVNFQFYKAA